jgi:hypothetical protein
MGCWICSAGRLIPAVSVAFIVHEAMPPSAKLVPVSIAIASPVPVSVPISAPIAVPVTTFIAVASPAVSIPAAIVAIVAALATLFPVESTDIAVAVAAIPPSIGIAIVLGQDGAIFDRVSCAGGAAQGEERASCKQELFHF